jgi:hypothetical protein
MATTTLASGVTWGCCAEDAWNNWSYCPSLTYDNSNVATYITNRLWARADGDLTTNLPTGFTN